MKTCTKCRATLPESEFNRCRTARDGLAYRCRACVRQAVLESEQRRRAELGDDEWRRQRQARVDRSRRKPQVRERARVAAEARRAASERLIVMYPYEFEKLLEHERVERGLPAERWERPQ